MFDKGLFGGAFDFNGDGKLDSFEKAAEFSAFMHIMSEAEKTTTNAAPNFTTNYGGSNIGDTTELEDALDDAGIDIFDFELMDDDERAEVLEDAGYDITDFDFD